ncbi:MAG TPA: hypothetical protein VFS17_01345 [Methylophilaceae bacterium]|nr:hypothetical protein [Methylophilaceae bacterium]
MSQPHQEYPKALYHNGELEGQCIIVFNEAEEKLKSEEGFAPLGGKKAKATKGGKAAVEADE